MTAIEQKVEAAAKAMYESWRNRGFTIPEFGKAEWDHQDGAARQFWRTWAAAVIEAVGLAALLDVAEAAQAVALKPYGNWKNDGCSCLACGRRALGEALARLLPSEACALCGRNPAAGTAGVWNGGVDTRLCHGDADPVPTCYSRWLHGERPDNRQKLPQEFPDGR